MSAPHWKARPEELLPQGNLRRVPIVHDRAGGSEIVGEGWGLTRELATKRAHAMALAPRLLEALRALLQEHTAIGFKHSSAEERARGVLEEADRHGL